ncbi:MAG: IPT/TIG domain-containing protein [Dysgonamonadaceae bacterium]|jgi:hypothetical protein|nr:IPT/TIG domain-containing protein [Dysgonamonadaceae bacterium]
MESRYRHIIILILAIACIATLQVVAQKPGNTLYDVELWLKADEVQSTPPANGASVITWTDMSGKGLDFVRRGSDPVPTYMQKGAFNFQPSLFWSAITGDRNLTLISNTAFTPNANKSYYVFTVSKPYDYTRDYAMPIICMYPAQSWGSDYQHPNSGVSWTGAGNSASHGSQRRISTGFNTTLRPTGSSDSNGFNDNDRKEGLISWIVPNNGTGSGDFAAIYLNGRRSPYWTGSGSGGAQSGRGNNWTLHNNIAVKMQLGQGGTRDNFPFAGEIMEVIILSTTGNTAISTIELRKIQSYLAIKYGLELKKTDTSFAQDNIVNSDGYNVWNVANGRGNHADDAVYSHNVFGIGRDDASGLNQKQSRSMNDDRIAVALGFFAETNNQNTGNFPDDKTYLLLGSNGRFGDSIYNYPAGTAFTNDVIGEKINYRSAAVYKAQITIAGLATQSIGQTVNIRVLSETAKYILVSTDSIFAVNNTRIYPITAKTATGVEINDGDYISIAYFRVMPGGINSAGLAMWLTPDSYNNGVWKNIIDDAIGNFTQPANWTKKTPPQKVTGQNFHPAVQFRPIGQDKVPNRLQSENGINLTTSDAFSFILVYKASNAGFPYQNILNFAGGNLYNGESYALGYENNNSDILSIGWTTNRRNLGAVPFDATALVTVDNNNGQGGTVNGIRHYLNGLQIANATTAAGAVNNQIVLGGGYWNLTTVGSRSVKADIQEIIMLKRPKAAYPFLENVNSGIDLRKINSYLAIKYGITLNNNDPYINSNGDTVWIRDANYNSNIFGIGCDELAGLYQKQGVSSTSPLLTAYIGSKLETLNSQNDGTFVDDRTFLMFGSASGNIIQPLSGINDSDQYENGQISAINGLNIQSPVYKTQLTNIDSMTVSLKVASSDFQYILVSNSDAFPPASTKFYMISLSNATVDIGKNYKYIKAIGFAPGPGGILNGLRLWLSANDELSLTVSDISTSDNKLAAYPDKLPEENELPVILEWKDLVRQQTYSYSGGDVSDNHRYTVLKKNSPLMNYHPSVRFWAAANNRYGAYLINPATNIMPWSRPPDGKHTAYFLVNNNFDTSEYFYTLSFGGVKFSYIPKPGYSAYKDNKGNMVGRFRADGNEIWGSVNLFTPGATSILGYQTRTNSSGGTNRAYFRFNGNEDSTTVNTNSGRFNWSNIDFQKASMLGPAYYYNRTLAGVLSEVILFDRQLDDDEVQRLESFLAFKYGITLHPSNTATGRFDYTFSNGTVIWEGNTASGKFADFYHNIAAIIRDNAARLNNRHSHSTNAGSLLHIGVAGTRLSDDGSEVGELENDLEAVVFGDDGHSGNKSVSIPCVEFKNRFERKWLIHKVTKNDRPVAMLVGAQDNHILTIGSDAATIDYYSKLTAAYNLYLIVADSPDSINRGLYKAVIPMSYINGEHQCNYIFSEKDTYITFGWTQNTDGGCYSTIPFESKKQFNWKQWTLNRVSNPVSLGKGEVDLDDGIRVDTTFITFANGITTGSYCPRSVSLPKNGIKILRQKGSIDPNSKVTTTIVFNDPVLADFFISGLDSRHQQYDEVTITGYCNTTPVIPKLTYAGDPAKAFFEIRANKARVTKNRSVYNPADKNGIVNIAFETRGVTRIVIEYTIKNRVYGSSPNWIYISPVNLRQTPLPPIINEDGLSFSKQVQEHNITTCDDAEYSFYLQNTNCEDKYVSFVDTLPSYMSWKAESVILDSINGLSNPKLAINKYAGSNILTIDSLVIPCGSTVKITAVAEMDERAPSGNYLNRASIAYERIKNNVVTNTVAFSIDRETHKDYTAFYATHQARLDKVKFVAVASSASYIAGDSIEVTLTIDNPNIFITDSYMNLNWDAGFKFAGDSIITNDIENKYIIYPNPKDTTASLFILAGSENNEEGFTLQMGKTTITFKLKAPDEKDLVFEKDEFGNPTGLVSPLNVYYEFSTGMDDPCLLKALSEMTGTLVIPFLGIKRIFVDEQATNVTDTTGLNNGMSWENAFLRFADALEVARNYPSIDSIFVAKGTYRPIFQPTGASGSAGRQDLTFDLPDNVKIFGGFENRLNGMAYDLDDRPNKNTTVLSGDMSGNTGVDTNDVYHVLTAIHSRGVEMDGFSVKDGYARGNDSLMIDNVPVKRYRGAGAYIADTASIVFRNMNFNGNRAGATDGGGAAIYSTRKSSVTIEESTFSSNAGTLGVAILNDSAAIINARNLIFTGNSAMSGAAIANFAVFNLDSARITGSTADSGAAIYSAGITNINRLIVDSCFNTGQTVDSSIIYSFNGDRLLLTNSLLRGNVGGIVIGDNTLDSLINCTLAGNKKTAIILTQTTSNFALINSVVYGNENSVKNNGGTYMQKYSLVQDVDSTSNGNVSGINRPGDYPRFSELKGYSLAPNTLGDYHTLNGSPVVNRGDSTYVKGRFPVDLDGGTRIWHQVDMGAYEEQSDNIEIKRVVPDFGPNIGGRYTNNSATGTPSGIDTTATGYIFLIGEGFTHGIRDITFGGVPAIGVNVLHDTILTCIPPAVDVNLTQWIVNDPKWYEGTVKITLTASNYLMDTIYYRYRHPIIIDSISPGNGPFSGGTQVKIFGHNFLPHDGSDSISVTFSLLPSDANPAVADTIKVTNDTIVVTTSAHPVNYVAVTVDNALEKTSLTGNPLPFTYYPTVFIVNGKWSTAYNWEEQSSDSIFPYPKSVIRIKANCEQDIDVDMDSITVYQGKSYTLDAGKKLNANVFTLKDNASFLNRGGIMNAIRQNLEHLLIKGRNWYVSSPMQGNTPPTIYPALGRDTLGSDLDMISNNEWRVEYYDEKAHIWVRESKNMPFVTGLGYTAYSKEADIAVKFSGTYSDGDQRIAALTRQNDSHPKRGFNLVGNPFPSYWRWTADNTQAVNLYSTIWYRTNVGMPPTDSTYQFWAYNAAGNVAVAPGWENEIHASPYSLAYIPPMQAFWVRIQDGQSSGTLTFTNDRRSHSNHGSNILKSVEATENEMRPLLRLTLTGGATSDETVIYADPTAQTGFDDYDSDKMFAGAGTELFTLPDAATNNERHELVINGLPLITDGTEITIGFQADETGSFSFRAKEILNLDTLDVILQDKWRKEEFNLRSDAAYNFTSGSTPNVERFSIVFRRSAGTGLPSVSGNGDNLLAFSEKGGRIIVVLQTGNLQGSAGKVSVYDVTGRKLTEQNISTGERTVLKGIFAEGIYVLRTGKFSVKVAVKND